MNVSSEYGKIQHALYQKLCGLNHRLNKYEYKGINRKNFIAFFNLNGII